MSSSLVRASTRIPFAATTTRRFLSSTSPAKKTAAETIQDVNKKAGQAAARGIEKGEQAAESLKSTVGMSSSEARGKVSETTGATQGKASEMAGEAKGKAQEMAGEAKGKAQEVKGEVKSRM